MEGIFFAQGDYFVVVGVSLISSEPQLHVLRKTLGIPRVDTELDCANEGQQARNSCQQYALVHLIFHVQMYMYILYI